MIGKRTLLVSFVLFFCSQLLGCAHVDSEAVSTLIELGKEDKGKEGVLAQQEQSFQRLKKAVQHRRVKKGFSDSKVTKRFGAPVAVLSEGKGTRWLYRGKKGSSFSAQKIYLFFDESNHLERWKCIRTDCETIERRLKLFHI